MGKEAKGFEMTKQRRHKKRRAKGIALVSLRYREFWGVLKRSVSDFFGLVVLIVTAVQISLLLFVRHEVLRVALAQLVHNRGAVGAGDEAVNRVIADGRLFQAHVLDVQLLSAACQDKSHKGLASTVTQLVAIAVTVHHRFGEIGTAAIVARVAKAPIKVGVRNDLRIGVARAVHHSTLVGTRRQRIALHVLAVVDKCLPKRLVLDALNPLDRAGESAAAKVSKSRPPTTTEDKHAARTCMTP